MEASVLFRLFCELLFNFAWLLLSSKPPAGLSLSISRYISSSQQRPRDQITNQDCKAQFEALPRFHTFFAFKALAALPCTQTTKHIMRISTFLVLLAGPVYVLGAAKLKYAAVVSLVFFFVTKIRTLCSHRQNHSSSNPKLLHQAGTSVPYPYDARSHAYSSLCCAVCLRELTDLGTSGQSSQTLFCG